MRSMLGPSESGRPSGSVRSGSSCISMKSASTPKATAARASALHVAALAAGAVAGAARELDRVGGVEHHRVAELAHDRESAHVHHEVVVAERRAALGEEQGVVAGGHDLVDHVLHVAGAPRTGPSSRSPACRWRPPPGPGRSAGRGRPGSAARRAPSAAGSTSETWWTSDRTGTPIVVPDLAQDAQAFRRARGPGSCCTDERLALS